MYQESPSRCLGGEIVDKWDSNSRAKEHGGSSPLQGIILRNENIHWMSNSIRGACYFILDQRADLSGTEKVQISRLVRGVLRWKGQQQSALLYFSSRVSPIHASGRACYGVLRFVMESRAKGCDGEVTVSGKLRAQHEKSPKFRDGIWFLLISQSMNLSTLC